MKFTLYESSTGRVQSSGTANDPHALAGAGQAVLEGARYAGGWIAGGVHHARPAQPGPHHTFDWTDKQWVDPRTLQDLKDAKWLEIKRARSTAEYAGFAWDGSTFDSDAISQARIQGAVQLAGMSEGFSIDWTLQDNTVRTLSAADMLGTGAALGLHVATQFAHARALREQIESATSPDAVAALHW